jgi:hypothetical protein
VASCTFLSTSSRSFFLLIGEIPRQRICLLQGRDAQEGIWNIASFLLQKEQEGMEIV